MCPAEQGYIPDEEKGIAQENFLLHHKPKRRSMKEIDRIYEQKYSIKYCPHHVLQISSIR